MRICSLMPGATEIVAALGLADSLVGISHECDYPPDIRTKPVLLQSVIDASASSSAEIDRQVREAAHAGRSLYQIDEEALAAAAPDMVIMQDLCDVCAITPAGMQAALGRLPRQPSVVSLRSKTLEEVFADILRIGEAVGRDERAKRLVGELRDRLAVLRQRVAGRPRPGVLCLEWLDPPYIASHWVPEMIDAAGGADLRGQAGTMSYAMKWEDVVSAAPDVIVLAPCSFSIDRTMRELGDLGKVRGWNELRAVQLERVFVADAAPYFSRSGPRLIDGAELLAALFHPEVFGPEMPAAAQRIKRHVWSTR